MALVQVGLGHANANGQLDIAVHAVALHPLRRLLALLVENVSLNIGWRSHSSSN